MSDHPTLSDIAREPAHAATLPLDAVPDLLADAARVLALLLARLLAPANQDGRQPSCAPSVPEPMLDAEQAAAMFNVTRRWLYRHAAQMGAHRLSRKVVRFTETGIRRYLARAAWTRT